MESWYPFMVSIMDEYSIYRKARSEWLEDIRNEIRKQPDYTIEWWNRIFMFVPLFTLLTFIIVRAMYGLGDILLLEEEYKLIRF